MPDRPKGRHGERKRPGNSIYRMEAKTMDMQQTIEKAEQDIRQALTDYRRHTRRTDVLDDISDEFIRDLARDSSYAKQGLRELFSRSPAWDESISALAINGTRTHDPDYSRIQDLADEILRPASESSRSSAKDRRILEAIGFFTSPEGSPGKEAGIDAINALAPQAYSPTRKPSRVFKALCTALGVADEATGSAFQRLYAQLADELSAKRIGFRLYVSINPAHFLTMSNPKEDRRGCMLTSCHSLNSTEYQYNNGCSGYARDGVSFIAFTVDDPGDPEQLNNRKTTRQVFAYRPGNGLLLQSRMYNTSGGTRGAQGDSRLYRDLVQRELSMLEGAPNLWKTYPYCGGHEDCASMDPGFGGYADWTYADFDGKVSIRTDHEGDYKALTVGAPGLCIRCGHEISSGLYCSGCGSRHVCAECEERFVETFTVHDGNGNVVRVCEACRDRYYTCCDECGEHHPDSQMALTGDGRHVCRGCLEELYAHCDGCGESYREEGLHSATGRTGSTVYVCADCLESCYSRCTVCGGYFHHDRLHMACDRHGSWSPVCRGCLGDYTECPQCGEPVEMAEGGVCPACGAVAGGGEASS